MGEGCGHCGRGGLLRGGGGGWEERFTRAQATVAALEQHRVGPRVHAHEAGSLPFLPLRPAAFHGGGGDAVDGEQGGRSFVVMAAERSVPVLLGVYGEVDAFWVACVGAEVGRRNSALYFQGRFMLLQI